MFRFRPLIVVVGVLLVSPALAETPVAVPDSATVPRISLAEALADTVKAYSSEQTVVEVDSVVTPPLDVPDARQASRREMPRDITVTVLVEVWVDEDGQVRDAKVLKSIPMLDQASVEAAWKWEFPPVPPAADQKLWRKVLPFSWVMTPVPQ